MAPLYPPSSKCPLYPPSSKCPLYPPSSKWPPSIPLQVNAPSIPLQVNAPLFADHNPDFCCLQYKHTQVIIKVTHKDSFSFWGGGGGGGGASTYPPPPPPPPREILILDLLLDALWWNLGLFSHKHHLPFMCH